MIPHRIVRLRANPLLALLAAVVSLPVAAAATIEARGGRIVEVTVFPDRAEVVREARVELPAGPSTVEFSGIPFTVEPDSLRVSATGVPAVLGAVEIRERADTPKETAEQAALRAEVRRLEGEIAKLGAQDRVGSDLREFLKSLRATTAQRESENLGAGRADPAAILAVYELLSKRLGELGDQELLRQAAARKLTEEIEVARAKLAAAPPTRSIRTRVATAEVEAPQGGALTLRLAYVASGASWRPSYRGTLDPENGEVTIVSEGVVRQKTGEDWSGVSLRLSTAAPALGVEPPQMASLLLRPSERLEGYAMLPKDVPIAGRLDQKVLQSEPGVSASEVADADAEVRQAEVVHSAYNVAFEVPGRSEVPADGADHRVVLRQETLPGTLGYRTAPALEPAAFLTSLVRAPERYPLLAGPMRVLAGGAYLGSHALPETAPGAELVIPFGRDNRIKVTRLRLPEERGVEGLTGKTRQIVYEYKTTVENLRDREASVTLEDRVPVSEDERIEVEMGKRTTPGHQPSKTRPGVLLWELKLRPRETKEVVLAYTVRFPRDLSIPGLE